jgi:hypothetical protein
MGVATAIAVGATVAGVAGSVISSRSQAKAQKRANQANLANAKDQRELERAIFLQSRGAEGFATLPFFATRGDEPVEPELFQYALSNYDALTEMPPDQRLAELKNASERFGDLQEGAVDTVAGIFDGSLTQKEVDNIAPLKDARLGRAEVIRQVGKEQLQAQINRINQQQRARGFSGDSLAKNQIEFDARRKIATEAALAESDAKIQNAAQEAQIKNMGISRQVGSVGMPAQLAESSLDVENAPARALVREAQTAQALFQPFNLGTGSYNPTPLPQVQPVAGTGAILGTGLAGLAGGIGNLATSGAFGPIGSSNPGGINVGTPVSVNSASGPFSNTLQNVGGLA